MFLFISDTCDGPEFQWDIIKIFTNSKTKGITHRVIIIITIIVVGKNSLISFFEIFCKEDKKVIIHL